MRFYFLVNSLELNSIFTTESISPKSIITNRNFSPVNSQNNIFDDYKDVLFLFEEFPAHPNVGTPDVYAFKTVFELNLDKATLLKIGDGIWASSRTIYLSPNTLKQIYVFDDFHAKDGKGVGVNEVLFNFERNRYTKNHHRYLNLIQSASDLKIKEKKYSIKSNKDTGNLRINSLIDSIVNSYKGLLYCFLAGSLGAKSNLEIELFKGLELIKNNFAIIKNRTPQGTKSNSTGFHNYDDTPHKKILEFRKQIKKNILIYSECFNKNKKFDYKKYEADFLEKYCSLGSEDLLNYSGKNTITLSKKGCISILKQFMFSGFNKKYEEKLQIYARERLLEEDPFYYCLELYQDLLDYPNLYEASYNKDKKDDISDEFNRIYITLENLTRQQFLEKKTAKRKYINFDFISIDSKNISFIFAKGFPLKKDNARLFSVICTELLNYRIFAAKIPSKYGLEYFRDNKNLLVQIGLKFKFEPGKFKDAYSEIYTYSVGKKKSYEINSFSAFPVQQNFAAFLIKPSNITELQEFLEHNNIQEKWISYAFWGIFNGFSRIDKTFIKPLFIEKQEIEILNTVDTLIHDLYSNLLNENFTISKNKSITELSEKTTTLPTGETIELSTTLSSDRQQNEQEDIPSIYMHIKNIFIKIIDNCIESPNKKIRDYINKKDRSDLLLQVLEKKKELINPHFINSIIDEILKEALISKRSIAWRDIISYHIDELIRDIQNRITC